MSSFYEKITKLKEDSSFLQNKKIALNIDGINLFMRIEFKNGFRFVFDELDGSPISTEYDYEQLYIEGNDNEVDNLFIPFLDEWEFKATSDINEFIDDVDCLDEYENIVFVIHTDTIDYIFTDDVE